MILTLCLDQDKKQKQDIIDDVVRQTNIDFENWKLHYEDPKTKEAVEKELLLAKQYGVNSVPCLVINGERHVSGALKLPQIIEAIQS